MRINFKKPFVYVAQKTRAFMARRPHRSFRITRRRDYRRSLRIPGIWAFTLEVNKLLWKQRKIFLWLIAAYAILSAVLVGMSSQSSYVQVSDLVGETGQQLFQGDLSQVGQAGILFASIASSGLNQPSTEIQQVYAALLGLLAWLTTVWLLRAILASRSVKMRDGLYQAGAPLVPTLLIGLVGAVQLLPIGLAALGYSAASASGLLDGGVEAMLFWFAAAFLAVLSLYWITSTFLAAIVVTLPGMYPVKALRIAGDMVVGRRLRILLRLLWAALCVAIGWAVVLIPFILLDTWLRALFSWLDNVPIIPVVIVILTTASVVWAASYVYVLYRKIVDDDALPA